jgi:ATP-dependent DNA ligase
MTKSYPILFKIDKNNKKRFWHIKIYQDDKDNFKLIIARGIVDGKITNDIINIIPKSNRTPLQQAELQANQRYKDKIRLNYRPENSNEKQQPLNVKPYLLKTYQTAKDKIIFPAIIQPKLDGVRALLGINDDKKVQFISRRCVEFPNPLTKLKSEFLKSNLPKNKKIFYDGEIYIHDSSIKQKNINGALQTSTTSKLYSQNKKLIDKLEFHIFDYFNLDKLDLSFEQRYNNLKNIFSKFNNKSSKFKLVPIDIVYNNKDIDTITNLYIKNRYEGSVIRNTHFKYDIKGNRLCDALKLKRFFEEEYKIVDATQGKYNQVIWILEYFDNKNNKNTFKAVHTDISRQKSQEYYKNRHKYIGLLATVKYQEKINGKPRFGIVIKIRDSNEL